MRTTEAFAKLLDLRRPILSTAEAAARLNVTVYTASKVLRRLHESGLTMRLRRGLWVITKNVDPLVLPRYLTAPYPSYISTWTALYNHGMISQIPREIYAVSLDRTKKVVTPLGVYVIQHITPRLFDGFNLRKGIAMATPEKALFDTVYLLSARGRRHVHLPEIDLPERFRREQLRMWIRRIALRRLRTAVAERIERILPATSTTRLRRAARVPVSNVPARAR